jgi:hypothetical protein
VTGSPELIIKFYAFKPKSPYMFANETRALSSISSASFVSALTETFGLPAGCIPILFAQGSLNGEGASAGSDSADAFVWKWPYIVTSKVPGVQAIELQDSMSMEKKQEMVSWIAKWFRGELLNIATHSKESLIRTVGLIQFFFFWFFFFCNLVNPVLAAIRSIKVDVTQARGDFREYLEARSKRCGMLIRALNVLPLRKHQATGLFLFRRWLSWG